MKLSGKRIAIVLGDNFNADVYHHLRSCLQGAGATVLVAASNADKELIDNRGRELLQPNLKLDDIQDLAFDVLILSDGSVSDDLRSNNEFHELIRHAHGAGLIIGTIDLSARYLIDAGIAATHSLTASPELRYELEVHGAEYENEPVWVDGNLISGRLHDDIQAFCDVLVDEISLEEAA
ncbi:MAG TPA: DJ-1/PfpI family protein [Candidatus Aquicultor sp.]|jgi:protease I